MFLFYFLVDYVNIQKAIKYCRTPEAEKGSKISIIFSFRADGWNLMALNTVFRIS
jgi:hypothetical protein